MSVSLKSAGPMRMSPILMERPSGQWPQTTVVMALLSEVRFVTTRGRHLVMASSVLMTAQAAILVGLVWVVIWFHPQCVHLPVAMVLWFKASNVMMVTQMIWMDVIHLAMKRSDGRSPTRSILTQVSHGLWQHQCVVTAEWCRLSTVMKDQTRLEAALDVLMTVCHLSEAMSARVVDLISHPRVLRFVETTCSLSQSSARTATMLAGMDAHRLAKKSSGGTTRTQLSMGSTGQ